MAKGTHKNLLQGCAEIFAQHLVDKITQISQLDTGLVAGPEEVPRVQSCLIIWELFEPVAPEEVDRVLRIASSTTCSLDPCPVGF